MFKTSHDIFKWGKSLFQSARNRARSIFPRSLQYVERLMRRSPVRIIVAEMPLVIHVKISQSQELEILELWHFYLYNIITAAHKSRCFEVEYRASSLG